MKNGLWNPGHIPATIFLIGTLTTAAANAGVVVSFSGQVTDLGGFQASPPAGVSLGSIVNGTVVYFTADATEVEVGPSERTYIFPAASRNQITVSIGTLMWKADLQGINVCDDVCDGDFLDCAGFSSVTVNFPGNLGTGFLSLEFSDADLPYDLLIGHDLPNAAEDIRFGSAQVKAGSVSSSDGTGFWAIQFDVNSQSVPVRASTWGEIKALYARP